MSFADYLGLNEASLRELEEGAMARAAAADEQASSALGKAYQQADADANAGGAGQLSQQMGYMDFVKAQREAESARALPTGATSPYEDAARASMRAGQPQAPSVAGRAQVMRQDLASRRGAVAAGRAAQKTYADRQQAERAAQQQQFDAAKQRVGIDDAAGAEYTRRSDAIANSRRRGTIGASGAYEYDRTR